MKSFWLRAFEHAIALLEKRYGADAGNNRLAFHNAWHTDCVVGRTKCIAIALGLTEREIGLALVAASCHDLIQKWERIERADGAIVRQRMVRINEMESAQEAVAWMRHVSGETFTAAELDLVSDAILVTIPAWDAAKGTVVQRRLLPNSHGVIRAVALADIASPGMDSGEFLLNTYRLFIEDNLDVAECVYDTTCVPGAELQQKWLERFRAFVQNQVSFARGRQALFEAELGDIDAAAKGRVRALFSQFDASIAVTEQLMKKSLDDTYQDMMNQLRNAA